MMTKPRMIVSGLSLICVPFLMAQVAPPPRPAPGRPQGPATKIGAPPQNGFGARVLKTRELQDKELDEKEQKKYDSLIAALEKRAAGGRSATSNSRATEFASAFRLASTHLRYGQEKSAKDTLEKGWQMAPELYREPKTAMAATGQIRTHLKELQGIAAKDPELALTLMSDLTPAHQSAFEAIEQDRAKGQLAQPLAQVWSQLMDLGQLDKDAMEKGSFWVLKYPQAAIADRPIAAEARSQYESELAQASVNINARLRELAQRQLVGRGAQPMDPNTAPDTVDPATALLINALDAKRGPIIRFTEADVHFKYGQFRRGIEATNEGWKELLEFYRSNPGAVLPADAGVHFETLDRLAGLNLVQALVLLDQTDPAYRGMGPIDPKFGVRVADTWAKMVNLPLNPPMLTKAAFWFTYVSKQHNDISAKHAPQLEILKQKLEQAKGEHEDDAEDDDHGKKDDDKDGEAKEHKNTTGRRGISVPKAIDPLKREQQ